MEAIRPDETSHGSRQSIDWFYYSFFHILDKPHVSHYNNSIPFSLDTYGLSAILSPGDDSWLIVTGCTGIAAKLCMLQSDL